MIGLYIFLGIIAFFVIILSIRITVNGEFFEEFYLDVQWLFVKIKILPAKKKDKKDKKPKKEKKKKEPKPKEEKPVDENLTEDVEKKDNIFVRFYKNQGFDGVVQLIKNVAYSLSKMMKSFNKHLVLRKLYLWMTVSEDQNAAETAIAYGKLCQTVFPAMSYICNTMTVKNYDVQIEPDFLGSKNKAEFAFSVSVRPIFFINAIIVLAFRLLGKVVVKFLLGARDKSKNNKNINDEKGGAL